MFLPPPSSAAGLQALLLLLLTGRASPNTFNGTRHCREDGRPLQRPLQGVLSRSDVGYLRWSREQTERRTLPAVSLLRTGGGVGNQRPISTDWLFQQ